MNPPSTPPLSTPGASPAPTPRPLVPRRPSFPQGNSPLRRFDRPTGVTSYTSRVGAPPARRPLPSQLAATPAPAARPQLIGRAGTQGVRFVYLGGLGEIGKNMMAIESGNDIIIIDCGVGFPTDEMLGVDLVLPDVRYLEERKQFIRAYFLTHGHEDHISGLPFLWPKIPAPVYGARLTLAFLEAKLEEHGLAKQVELRLFKPGDRIQAGVFNVEPVRVNHAIPDACGFAIRTPEGLIFHTGDWKIDHTPVSGEAIDFNRIAELSKEGITMLMSDSTNVEVPGYTVTERVIAENLDMIFKNAHGRVIIASCASQINRIQQIFDSAAKFNRRIGISGRSLERNSTIALKYGYIKAPEHVLTDIRQINRLPDNEVVILATGSQGEQYSALSRMAAGDHRHIKIKPGDTVVLSASVVPGNESSVDSTVNNLYREGAEVIRNREVEIHVSGHAGQEELKLMLALTKPKFFVPVHGEFSFLVKHARLAHSMGVDQKNIFVAEDGDYVEIVGGQGRLIQNKVEASYVLVDGSGVGDVGNIVLRDRQAMAKDGMFMVIVTVDHKTGKILTSPDIISRGFVYMRAAEDLIFKSRQEVKAMFARHNDKYPMNWEQIKRLVREDLGEFLFQKTQRRPMIIPVIIEL